jgi:hypothetical protein
MLAQQHNLLDLYDQHMTCARFRTHGRGRVTERPYYDE